MFNFCLNTCPAILGVSGGPLNLTLDPYALVFNSYAFSPTAAIGSVSASMSLSAASPVDGFGADTFGAVPVSSFVAPGGVTGPGGAKFANGAATWSFTSAAGFAGFLDATGAYAAKTALGAAGATAAGLTAFAAVLLYPNSTAADDTYSRRNDQYVIRGGLAAPSNLQVGTGPVRNFEPLTGFSVTSAPGMSLDALARYAQYPNTMISYTTVRELAVLGIQVVPTPQPNDPLHSTVVVPDPLPDAQAEALSSAFSAKMPNQYRNLGSGRNLSTLYQ